MDNVFLTIFSISLLLILHTYLIYPLLMVLFFGKARTDMAVFLDTAEFPSVSILIAAFNEEKVIEQKIKSIFDTHYPMQKITVIVGSDASTDKTDEIINGLKQKFVNLHLIRFSGRVGKIGILNHLQNTVQDEYLILTDANVMFNNTTIYELLKYFKQTDVGIVAANIMKESPNNSGISVQEKKYLSLENKIKFCESNAFKLIMGAEGGCYAIRNKYFRQVPINFIVDDFFITLSVLKMGQQAIFNPNAICTEDVTGEITGEYKRKVRISSGNFQNLFYFKSILPRIWTPISFTFWSHKVLRWFTPFLLLICLISSAFMIQFSSFFIYVFCLQVFGIFSPLINYFFSFRNSSFRFISHFYLMNFALLEGFVKFCKGIKTSVWQPIQRNVQ